MVKNSKTKSTADKKVSTKKTGSGDKEKISNIQKDKVPLRYYTDLIISSIWEIVIFVVLCVGVAYLLSSRIQPTYLVTTTIMVRKANIDSGRDYETFLINRDMARTYAEMITSVDILNLVRKRVDLNVSLGQLSEAIISNPISATQLIEISVEYSDPEIAVQIVNSLVEVFSSQIETAQLDSTTDQDNMLEAQLQNAEHEINLLQEKIEERSLQIHKQRLETINRNLVDIVSQIEKLNEEMAPFQVKTSLRAPERVEFSNLETHKKELSSLLLQYQEDLVSTSVQGAVIEAQDFESKQDLVFLDQYQRIYFSLLQNYQNLNLTRIQNKTIVIQVDQPVLPTKPIRPILLVNLVLGFAVGLILATIYIYFEKLGVQKNN